MNPRHKFLRFLNLQKKSIAAQFATVIKDYNSLPYSCMHTF